MRLDLDDLLQRPPAQALQQEAKRQVTWLKGRRLWLACSGGRDSMSLAWLCRQLFDQGLLGAKPQLLYVDHAMQEASLLWGEQVLDWAKSQDLPCQILKTSVPPTNELEARQIRYALMFAQLNAEDVLILGHHQQDQAETLLLKLLRGSGLQGLSGMQALQERLIYDGQTSAGNGQPSKRVWLWRPWLSVTREQITELARSAQLPYIDDPTNQQCQGLSNDRAWLRSHVLPVLKDRNPNAIANLAHSSQLLTDSAKALGEVNRSDLSKVQLPAWKELPDRLQSVINLDAFARLHPARQSTVLATWLWHSTHQAPASKNNIEATHALALRKDANHQTRLTTSNGYWVTRYRNHLYRMQSFWPLPFAKVTTCYTRNQTAAWLLQSMTLPDTGHTLDWVLPEANLWLAALPKHIQALDAVPYAKQAVALNGRLGRKKDKKLMQTLQIPTFYRPWLLLIQAIGLDGTATALALIAPNTTTLLQSPYAKDLSWVVKSAAVFTKPQL